MIESNILRNNNYKTIVTYGEKEHKEMVLSGEQILEREKINRQNKSKHKPYIKIKIKELINDEI